MLKKLSSPWIGSVMGLLCFLGVTYATWNAATANITAVEHKPSEPRPAGSDMSAAAMSAVEVEALVTELREEREAVDKREKALREWEDRLKSERGELTKLTQDVQRMQKEFDASITRVNEEEAINLKKIAKTYIAMEPDAAAGILKQMDDGAIVKYLMFMKEAETGPILAALSRGGEAEAKRAADLTEKLRLSVQPKKK